ncbi:hypothetical protein C1H46_027436 [Malus baccata]|uniref:Alpha/beta hydrolase fold-3 domain-containing protein n=1 Tax=Malus baccata TaxID=106549 RepID=A0A540LKJ0_MALBA|nr:hypothetical protein C1H46_027436 [Malus baccata]
MRPTSNPHFCLLNPPFPPHFAFFYGTIAMAKFLAVIHLHLLCNQDSVSLRGDGDKLEEGETQRPRFGVVEATKRNTIAVACSGAFLDLPEFWFHGGGFVSGSNNTSWNDAFCRRMAKLCDAIVMAVGYRLAPESPYPAAFEDGVTVLKWVAKQANLASVRNGRSRIFDSFGSSTVEPWLAAHGDPSRCVVLGKLFLTEEEFDLDHPAGNPLMPAGIGPPLKTMPRTLTVVAEHDWMRDRGIAYSEELRKANVDAPLLDYKDSVHEFATLDVLLETPQAKACAEDITIWVKKYISLRGHEFSY